MTFWFDLFWFYFITFVFPFSIMIWTISSPSPFTLDYGRQVSVDAAEKKARELSVMYIETSAKAGYNVKQVGHIAQVCRQELIVPVTFPDLNFCCGFDHTSWIYFPYECPNDRCFIHYWPFDIVSCLHCCFFLFSAFKAYYRKTNLSFFPLTNLKLSFSLLLSSPSCCWHLPQFCLCSTLPARTWADRSPRRRASRELRNWMSCSLKPVQKLATMSNRYRLNENSPAHQPTLSTITSHLLLFCCPFQPHPMLLDTFSTVHMQKDCAKGYTWVCFALACRFRCVCLPWGSSAC